MGPRGLWAYFQSDPTWSQRSFRGQSALEMPYGYQIWWGDPLTKAKCIAGVKGHALVIRGQPRVKLLRNALWSPNLVGRITDQSVMQYWVKGHVGVSWGQVGVNLLSNALWPPNLVERTPAQSIMHCWGQRSCRGHQGSMRGQIA